ncbi:hypothetical protein Lalb_Chr21g0314071 [Lupinus albus]|uniref:Uncharacterized protein n=1 Tax=Lupinus albus TaxID=3870 RepID=A0A6A4NQM6_LUPAL|nr:hypothetical protein Lalb_Chr21g0314071 [Lupinus albus]
MGCFLHCFGSSKCRKRKQHSSHKRNSGIKPQKSSVSSLQDLSKSALINPSSQLQDKSEEQLSVSTGPSSQLQDKSEEQLLSLSTRKKVTFDSNVKTYEAVLQDEAPENKNIEDAKVEAWETKPTQSKSSSSENSSLTSTGSYPPNHRYQNSRVSDDELDYGASDLSEDYEGDNGDFEEEHRMVYSSPTQTYDNSDDVNSVGLNLNPNARERSVYVHPVLNPVENLTQWKVVKSKRTKPSRPQNENYLSYNHESKNTFGTEEPSSKEQAFSLNSDNDTSRKLKQENSVDASLSNWLVSPQTTPVNKAGSVPCYAGTPDSTISRRTVISHEDRPILGALTIEEIRQFSATPRKSPSHSLDEMPIIGTVGTYWSFTDSTEDSSSVSSFKGIPKTTRKY